MNMRRALGFASKFVLALAIAPIGSTSCVWQKGEPLVDPVVASRWENLAIRHPRLNSTAVPLQDGRVLILGGEIPNVVNRPLVTATEIYEPDAKAFVAGPSLPIQSLAILAAPTSDGVLVSGSFDDGRAARMLDPATGALRAVGGTSVPHDSSGAIVPLLDGTVLIMGGGGRESHRVAELYAPSGFTRVGDLTVKRFRTTATLLKNGRVLVTGGTSSDESTYNKRLADCEIYDPATRSFAKTGSMRTSRDTHTATRLLDGRVLIAGGISEETGITASAEIYDPATGQFHEVAPMRLPRASHGAALLADGRVLVIGGNSYIGGSDQILRSAELFDPSSERFVEVQPMPSPRESFTATLLRTGDVLVVGGWDGMGGGTAALFHLESTARVAR